MPIYVLDPLLGHVKIVAKVSQVCIEFYVLDIVEVPLHFPPLIHNFIELVLSVPFGIELDAPTLPLNFLFMCS